MLNLPENAWRRLSAGDGTKGARLHDWAYLELADLDVGEYNGTLTGMWARGLLIRRNIADGDLAFFSTWCPKDTPMKKLVFGRRPSLGHRGQFRNRQKRTRPRSQRDTLLAWLAPSCLAGHACLRHDGRHRASRQCRAAAQKNHAPSSDKTSLLIRWSVQEIRRIVVKLAQRASNPRTSSHGHSGEELTKPKHAAPISKRECNCNARHRSSPSTDWAVT